jgi:Membrane bound O-acyl transferase family
MTLLFLLALGVLGFSMKLIALLLPVRGAKTGWRFIASPLVSPSSMQRLRPASGAGWLLGQTCLYGVLMVPAYLGYWWLVERMDPPVWMMAYPAALLLLLSAETVTALVPLLWLPTGDRLPPLMNHPALTRGLTEFWSARWNLWFSDWFRYAIFSRMQATPLRALFTVFAISGVMHEGVVNVPLYLVTGQSPFGMMMIYFLIQPVAMLIERRFLANAPRTRIAFAWLTVLGPIPLFMNEGLLRVFLLWPGS